MKTLARLGVLRYLAATRWKLLLWSLFPSFTKRPVVTATSVGAFYLPTYLIDFYATVDTTSAAKRRYTTPVRSRGAYLNGFEYVPLSDHSFATPADADLQPFDAQADHLTSDGDKITVLPYTQSPLKLLSYISSRPSSNLPEPETSMPMPDLPEQMIEELTEDRSILPKSIKTKFLAIYPIYQPVWLVECDLEQEGQAKRKMTIALFNFFGPGWPGVISIYDTATNEWHALGMRAGGVGQIEVGSTMAAGVQGLRTMAAFSKLFGDFERDRTKLSSVTKDTVCDMKHPNIVRFSETAAKNREYLEVLWNLDQAQQNLKAYQDMEAGGATVMKAMKLGPGGLQPADSGELIKAMESSIEGLLVQEREKKPDWMS